MAENFWPTLGAGLLGTFIGAAATIAAAFINRQPTLAAVVDARIKALIESYEQTIRELRAEIGRLENKIDILTKELHEERARRGFGS